MRIRLIGVALATTTALTLLAAGTAAAKTPPGRATPVADVWVTTVDGIERLSQRAPVAFGAAPSAAPTIVVDPDQRFQTMEGFGASITDSSAAVLYELTPAVRDEVMRELFDPEAGIGISFLRQPIGSSDFTDDEHYTYDDMPPGETDFDLSEFSIAHDEAQILPLLRQALALNPDLSILATPWSQPAWMKANDSLIGGRMIDDPAVYDAYARYLVAFVEAYAAAGVPIDYISVQNEPQNRAPDAYPGTDMPVEQQLAVIAALGPLLQAASPGTKILGYDHNWALHPGDIATTPAGEDPNADYPYDLLRSDAARWIDGIAYHCYAGDPSAMTALHDAFPDTDVFFTECSGSHGPNDSDEQVFRDTLKWHARNVVIGTTRNWAKSVVNWNIALDENDGPHNGGCGTCTGLVTVHDPNTYTLGAEYYTIGHLSAFVDPGAVRIGSTSHGTTGWNGQIMDVAFENPDGSTVLVVHNEHDDPRTFAVQYGGKTFEYTAPGGALLTFVWDRSPRLNAKLHQVSIDGATASANPPGSGVANLVDDDASTRWTSVSGQTPGQYVQVDLGQRKHFRTVHIDYGGNLGDYAPSWELAVSTDGLTWRTIATGTGGEQLEIVEVRNTHARYLRLTNTGSSEDWWSIADIRLYK